VVCCAGKLPAGVLNAIGAGPNLLTYDVAHNASVIDIPANSTINVFEHAANTGALSGLVRPGLLCSEPCVEQCCYSCANRPPHRDAVIDWS
jgi:hypothetical protein